ncbi:hypothetical protein [Opitutus sp. ER46]|uniref:hypothetical protein n=1 Tax=Opitutus sp. ER46 TaxID=2161864 RepID=UPI000D2FF2C5|nr:hypothetical protein [Opitutus sp. ER46]PTX94419.1 hypothetical protein DB354_11760 [Opitutus sp. ER46]
MPQRLSPVCWIAVAILAAFMCVTHLGVMLSLMVARGGLALAAPLGLVLALLLGDVLARRAGLTGRARVAPAVLALLALAGALGISAWFFDLSWDGQWYHQWAVYSMAQDWNPLAEPMREFPKHVHLWVRHYAKGTWYVATAIFQTTGMVELGKCPAVFVVPAMALAVFAAGLDWGFRRLPAGIVAALVACNPVVFCELTTYLVDSIMYGFLVVVAAAVFSTWRQPRAEVLVTAALATIVCVNAKFTGLVFLGFVFAAGWIWCAWHRRAWLWRYTGGVAAVLVLAIVGFGYNPYVTNAMHRGQPFYPVLGSRAFPSLTTQGKEGIELYETPKNLLGHNRLYRLAYATFGRPGNAPYRHEPNAALMWPFTARPADLFYYNYHEVRIAGFGPFFSGALLLAFGLGLWLLLPRSAPSVRGPALLTALAVAGSLVISEHLWWPRYGPQLWLLALVPVPFILHAASSRWMRGLAWTLVALLLVNTAIVGAVHLTWEARHSAALRRQLIELRAQHRPIEISIPYFEVGVEERLKTWGISYQKRGRKELRDAEDLISVVEGYPGAVKYRVLP